MGKEQLLELLKILQCPISGGILSYDEKRDMIYSSQARAFFPIKYGIPILTEEESITQDDNSQ